MSRIMEFIRDLFGRAKNVGEIKRDEEKLYREPETKETEIHSIWDFLKINENSQALHIISVIGFDEWVTMEEIRQRILAVFYINYGNERSLYPYLKTMVDLGIMEINNVGGKRKWRKKDLLIKIEQKKKNEDDEKEGERVAAT